MGWIDFEFEHSIVCPILHGQKKTWQNQVVCCLFDEMVEYPNQSLSYPMHQVCGEYLSKREGARYKIVEGDAFEEMEKLRVWYDVWHLWRKTNHSNIERQFQSDPEQRFDFIFGDLTDTPIQVDESGDKCDANSNPDNVTWTFIKEVCTRQDLEVI